jgi:hypothetical protein
MQLPLLDRAIRGRLRPFDRRFDTRCRPLRDGAKPMFEFQRSFEGDSTQTAKGYRRGASSLEGLRRSLGDADLEDVRLRARVRLVPVG